MRWIAGLIPALVAGLVSVLLLTASNLEQGLALSDLQVPILVSLLLAGIAWLAAGLMTRSPPRRGIIGVALTFGWLSYGYYAGPVEDILPIGLIPAKVVTLALFSCIWLAAAVWFGRRNRDLTEFSRALSLALVVMATLTTMAVIRGIGSAKIPEEASRTSRGRLATDTSLIGSYPDIYLLVLDAYSRSDHLREIYDFDNSEFEKSLRELGFQIPSQARANYTATFLALTAMLNWNYLDVVLPQLRRNSANRKDVYALLESNVTARELQNLGYEFIFFRSMYPPLSRSRLADRQIPDRLSGEFERYFLSLTVLAPIGVGACAAVRCFTDAWSVSPAGSTATKLTFGAIAGVASDSHPKFIFAHILLPHEPFRLDADCVPTEPVWPEDFFAQEERTIRRLYAAQVQCTNQLVLDMVKQILENATTDPIILIQSDHGYGRLPWGEITDFRSTDSTRIRERLSVFAAYRFPGVNAPVIQPWISPVNVFRLVFSTYFGRADLGLLEDRSFWSDAKRPFDLIPIAPAE